MTPPHHRQRVQQQRIDEQPETASFGAWLRQRRRALDLTQAELAQLVGCARITIRRIEADELKPSKALAELLANQLHVPAAQREAWLHFARGLEAPPTLPTVIAPPTPGTLPPFLQSPTRPEAQPRLFVAREQELAHLHRLLALTYAGQGRVAFVTGEAGSGKSMLVQEFARRAQHEHPGLVVATGSGQAFAGIGDPYLPFRELLALLTGDVEARWAAGALSRAHAATLWSLLPQAAQVLLAESPSLIDTFIPGAALLQRAHAVAGTEAPWVKQLATLVRTQATPHAPRLQQQDLFAQTTRFCLGLARRQPLLLLLDDLQWADAGSIHLLFHLGRHLVGSRILLLGLYRPADVALGRPAFAHDPAAPQENERHPLLPVVAELQRTFGEAAIDLQQADGRALIQALLTHMPYRLPPTFPTTLYHHTEGHALFTVELLRALQTRGDLVQDAQGVWVEGPTLNWETLPAQVEGMIGERIGRLPPPLQTLLTVAAVEGESFTAEVIATVQGSRETQVINQLSNLLDKQHGLVRVQEVQHLPAGRLSHYRFRHHLFQKYLYQRLDDAERATLHEAVGRALVQRYSEESAAIAPQLARHFELAGQTEMALTYLRQAGDTAARLFANNEAADYYRRALALATSTNTNADLIHFYSQLGPILELGAHYEQALANYTALEALARQRGDQATQLAALLARLPIYAMPTPLQDPRLGHRLGHEALRLARALHDQEAEAKILWNLSLTAMQAMQIEQAIIYGEQSLALARALCLVEQTAWGLTHLGMFCYSCVGRFIDAVTAMLEASEIWRQLDNLPLLSQNVATLGVIHVVMGQYQLGITASAEALQIAQELNDHWGQACSVWNLGYAYWEQGDVDLAYQTTAAGVRSADHARHTLIQVELRAKLAAFYNELGAYERNYAIASDVVGITEANKQYVFMTMLRVHVEKTFAQFHLHQQCPEKAEHFVDALRTNPVRKTMPGYYAWNDVDLIQAELAFQQEAYDNALAIVEQWLTNLRQFGLHSRLPYALHMQGKLHLALGNRTAAHAAWQAACAEAEALGSRWALWQILAALAQLEEDAAQAAQLRQEAQAIVTYITDHISDAELRMSFLSLPAVKALF
ncbi:MAG: AAA family ATPase [Caldilineaceae bacterium]